MMPCCGCKDPTTKDAYRLCVASLFFTMIGAIAGISLFFTAGSSLCLVYGLENLVDFLSSAAVLWRFFAPGVLTQDLENKLAHREQRASLMISIVLLLLGIFVIIAGSDDLKQGAEDPEKLKPVIVISFFSIIIFGILAGIKFVYAIKLRSASLYKDGVCSMIGTILSIALFVNSLIIETHPGAWWIDPIVTICVGCSAIVYGVFGVFWAYFKEGLPLFSCRWWLSGKISQKGEPAQRPGSEDVPAQPEVQMSEPSPQKEDAEII